MEITVRYTRSNVHLQGLEERSKGSGMNYAVSACSALSRSGSRMGTRTTHGTVRDALKAAQDFAKAMNLKVCKNCLKAAEANIEPEVAEAPETKACRQCGAQGDDSMESYAKDMCGYCSDAGNVALVWADADKAIEEESAPEYRGHKISCPFFGPDYDHCDCGTESDARVIVEDTEACESCSHPMDEHSHGFDCDQCACGDSKYTAYDEGTCKSQSVLYGVACARTQGHLGLHRNSKSAGPKHGFTDIKFWGTNEAR